MSNYKGKRNNYKQKKRYEDLTFEEKLELYLEQSKENLQILAKRYNRMANSRKFRNKNRNKGASFDE